MMSNEPSFLSSSDSLHTAESERNARLQMDAFQARLRAFEESLHTAIDTELQFRKDMTESLNSLHMLIAEQRAEDARLTDLVQQDTQRSREVMADYDSLASSFRQNVQPPDPTRLRDAFRTVGIVLSFIFMAPIQVILWLVTQFITRLRFGTTCSAIFSRLKGANAYGSAPVTVVTVRKGTTARASSRHHRRLSMRSGGQRRNGSDFVLSSTLAATASQSATLSPGTQTLPSSVMNGLVDMQNEPLPKCSYTHGETLIDSEEIEGSDGSKQALRKDSASSSSSDVFVDARTCNVGSEQQLMEEQAGDDGETETSGERDGRPAWALPLNSESALADMGNFPSAEFWHICDEEMKLDF
ncbi:unnamed protein product [Agarophyton chilense]